MNDVSNSTSPVKVNNGLSRFVTLLIFVVTLALYLKIVLYPDTGLLELVENITYSNGGASSSSRPAAPTALAAIDSATRDGRQAAVHNGQSSEPVPLADDQMQLIMQVFAPESIAR